MENMPPIPEHTQQLPQIAEQHEERNRYVDAAQLAVHGIAAAYRTWRGDRAQNTANAIDTREALYAGARGVVAYGDFGHVHETPNRLPARPNSRREARLERRADKRALKRDIADTYVRRAQKVSKPGVTYQEKWQQTRMIDKKNMTATEARVAFDEIYAQDSPLGSTAMKHALRGLKRTDRSLNRSTGGKITRKIRKVRYTRAEKSAVKHHTKAHENKTKVQDIHSRQAQQRIARRARQADNVTNNT